MSPSVLSSPMQPVVFAQLASPVGDVRIPTVATHPTSAPNIRRLATTKVVLPTLLGLKELDAAEQSINKVDRADLVPQSLSNARTREWYHGKLAGIRDEIDPNLSYEGQARQAMDLRNKYKLEARTLMQDQAAANALPPPKTPDEAIAKYRSQGFDGDDLWLEILGSSARTNKEVDNAVLIGASTADIMAAVARSIPYQYRRSFAVMFDANTTEDGANTVDDGYKALGDVLKRVSEGGPEAVLDGVIKSDDLLEAMKKWMSRKIRSVKIPRETRRISQDGLQIDRPETSHPRRSYLRSKFARATWSSD